MKRTLKYAPALDQARVVTRSDDTPRAIRSGRRYDPRMGRSASVRLLALVLTYVLSATLACGSSTESSPTQSSGPTADGSSSGVGGDGGSISVSDASAESAAVGIDSSGVVPTEGGSPTEAGASGPIDLASATIYCVYTAIFSANGKFADVTAQLPRIHALGFNVVWLMPVTPVGQPINGHPSYDSPYCVHDYSTVNPAYGTEGDLATLVSTAHALGVKVILDEVLNHTSWDNALITQHPEYYLHSDGNPQNVASIEQAFTYQDSAQLDYKSPANGLAAYMKQMLQAWITKYDLDGFRFDTADNPYGDGRLIPASFWQSLRPALESIKPGFLMLGEEQDPALAEAPFELDYGWTLQGQYGAGGLKQVASGGAATLLAQAWQAQGMGEPAGMRHMTLLQDWDMGEDIQVYGGPAQTMAAAAFNFMIDGVPLLFNGEEVGNDESGNNTHTAIDWNGPNAATFAPFYTSLLALRNANTALQQGAVNWVTTSAPAQVASFTRSDVSGTFLVLVNFSNAPQTGTITAPPPAGSGWTDVSPTGSPGGTNHMPPPGLSLAPHDFAVFRAQ
jgi:cyclomaltodextrinase